MGVISGLAYKSSKGKADELTTRNDLEMQRLAVNQKAIESQMAGTAGQKWTRCAPLLNSSKSSWMP